MGEGFKCPRGSPLWSPNKARPPCWVRDPAGSKACTLFRIHKIRRPYTSLMVVKMGFISSQGSFRSVLVKINTILPPPSIKCPLR